jgi:DNA-binding transcriptional LysR family regulator
MHDLAQLNLNLLLSLEALLAETNVTRAARRLGVTQPTMSRALRRLREELGDALLVRSGQGFVRTPRGERIHASLRDGLQALRRALGTPAFDPATARHTVALAAQDVVGVFLLPALLRRIGVEAPGLSLDVQPLRTSEVASQLEGGALDLAIGVHFPDVPGLCRRLLFRDGWVCLARRDHPSLRGGLDVETFLRVPHALASPEGDGVGVVDRALAVEGRKRRVAYRTRYFIGAALAVAQTDVLLTLPARAGHELARRLDLAAHPPPLALPALDVTALWHARLDLDPLQAWVRDALIDASTPSPSSPQPDGSA